ncbi:hypothetical protein HDU96_004925 [Phlyctochytrium bullatum]|nr:hypothetical protein HDU96_004925 [Phlyctochytrium bullatum]
MIERIIYVQPRTASLALEEDDDSSDDEMPSSGRSRWDPREEEFEDRAGPNVKPLSVPPRRRTSDDTWEREPAAKETADRNSRLSASSPGRFTADYNDRPTPFLSRPPLPTGPRTSSPAAPSIHVIPADPMPPLPSQLANIVPTEWGGKTTPGRSQLFSNKVRHVTQLAGEEEAAIGPDPVDPDAMVMTPDPEYAFLRHTEPSGIVSPNAGYLPVTNAGVGRRRVFPPRNESAAHLPRKSSPLRHEDYFPVDVNPRSGAEMSRVPLLDLRVRDKYLNAHFTHLYRDSGAPQGERGGATRTRSVSPQASAGRKASEQDSALGLTPPWHPAFAEQGQVSPLELHSVPEYGSANGSPKQATPVLVPVSVPNTNGMVGSKSSHGLLTPEPEDSNKLTPPPSSTIKIKRWVGSPPIPQIPILNQTFVASPSPVSDDFEAFNPDRPIDMISVEELMKEPEFPKRSSSRTREAGRPLASQGSTGIRERA